MDYWNVIVDIFEKLVTCLGIIIAGIWTYLLFVRQRLGLPKVEINLIVDEVLLPENTKLVHVEICLKNVGGVILTSNSAELRLRQIVPIPTNLHPILEKGYDPISPGQTEIEWPMLVGRKWNWEKGDFEIEPGEKDSLHADFFIPNDVLNVEFYCFISNAKKKRKGIGWTHTKIYNIKLQEKN